MAMASFETSVDEDPQADLPHGNPDSDDRQSFKTCSVCKDVSGHFYLNYGAATCFSCRAFFRRAHQKTKSPSFACKNDDKCVIKVDDRKCRACRYNLCIQAGMKPELVLDNEQKTARFRKLIEKKQELDPSAPPTITIDNKPHRRKDKEAQQLSQTINSPYQPKKRGRKPKITTIQSPNEKESGPIDDKMTQGSFFREENGADVYYMEPATKKNVTSSGTNKGPCELPECLASPTDDTRGNSLSQITKLDPPFNTSNPTTDILTCMAHGYGIGQCTATQMVPGQACPLTQNTFQQKLSYPQQTKPEEEDFLKLILDMEGASGSYRNQEDTLCQSKSSGLDTTALDLAMKYQFCWMEAMSSMEVPQEFLDNLSSFHNGYCELVPEQMKLHFSTFSKMFADFAFRQDQFRSLNNHDQRKLLERNTPLFAQYLIAQYLTAPTAKDQMRWLLFDHVEQVPSYSVSGGICPVSISQFSKSLNLFQDDMDMAEYFLLCQAVRDTGFNFQTVYLVAFACLYQMDYTIFFDDPYLIQAQSKILYQMSTWANESLGGTPSYKALLAMLETLEKMSPFFQTSEDWRRTEEGSSRLKQSMLMPYTQEEEKWLCQQFEKLTVSFQEVSFGEEMINEFVTYNYDVPLSRAFIPNFMAVWVERHRHILKKHEEFNHLTWDEQAMIMQNSVYSAVALSISKLGSCENGNEQMNFAVGNVDNSIFKESYSGIVDQTKTLAKIRLKDVNPYAHLVDVELMQKYYHLMESLYPLVKNTDSYKLLTMIIMFSESTLVNSGSYSMVDRYLTLLRRRLHYLGEDDSAYDRILVGMKQIRELSVIIKTILYLSSKMGK